jgi:hypothetical protein
MTRRKYQAATVQPGEVIARRRIPTRAHSIRSDFVVPALAGIYCAVFGGLLLALLFWLVFGYFWMPFGIFMTVFALAGFLWRTGTIDRLITATEDVRRMPGEPEPPAALALPEVRPPVLLNPYTGRERADAEERNADEERFLSFVRECQFGTSYAKWRGKEPKYEEYRDRLIASGWASWRKENEPRAGWMLNADAEHIVEALSGD